LTVRHGGSRIDVPEVIVDTGSARTLLSADVLLPLGVTASTGGHIHTLEGIGGIEHVFSHRIDRVVLQTRGRLDFGTLTLDFPDSAGDQGA
jgi:hypothetical protein